MFRELKPDKSGIFLPSIEIKEHPVKGYICVAAEEISEGSLIERCPTIKFAASILKDLWNLNNGRVTLHDYFFVVGGNGSTYSYIAMGYGGIYSHSDRPNAKWKIVEGLSDRETIEIRATKQILKGEEITVRYLRKDGIFWFDPIE